MAEKTKSGLPEREMVTFATPVVVVYPGGKKVTHESDDKIPCTDPDGEPRLVPAWRVKDLVYERGFKVGYPKKKGKAADKEE